MWIATAVGSSRVSQARVVGTQREVGLLGVQEEGLVPTSQYVEAFTADQQDGTERPVDLVWIVVAGRLQYSESNGSV